MENKVALINEILEIHPQRIQMLIDEVMDGYIDISMKTEREIVKLALTFTLCIVSEYTEAKMQAYKRFMPKDTDLDEFYNAIKNRFIHRNR